MTCRDIIIERALNKDDPKLVALMTKRVGVALRGQKEKCVCTSVPGPGQYALWALS